MQFFFSAESQWLWTLVLCAALIIPVRHVIWALLVRRADSKNNNVDEAESLRLKKRAFVTSALLSFIFSVIYVNNLFQGTP